MHVSDLFGAVLILAVLLFLFSLLQEIFLQCERLGILVVGPWLYRCIQKYILEEVGYTERRGLRILLCVRIF